MKIAARVARSKQPNGHHNTLVQPMLTVMVVDEIGLPYRDIEVRVTISDGREYVDRTNDKGQLTLSLARGDEFEMEVIEFHEVAPEDSSATGSGQHFVANGTGPAGESDG